MRALARAIPLRRLRLWCFAAVFALVGGCPSCPGSGPHQLVPRVTGVVTGDGAPLSGTRLALHATTSRGEFEAEASTDAHGEFEFPLRTGPAPVRLRELRVCIELPDGTPGCVFDEGRAAAKQEYWVYLECEVIVGPPSSLVGCERWRK